MRRRVYEFKKSLNVGELGEDIVENYLLKLPNVVRVESVKDIKKYQEDDIDFIVHFKNGKKSSIEVKCDSYKSGNLYYETKSCAEYNTVGCLEKTKADYIFYYFLNLKILYIFKTNEFRDWVRDEIKKHYINPEISRLTPKKVYNKSFNQTDTYTSLGYTIPLNYIEDRLYNTKVYKKYYNI